MRIKYSYISTDLLHVYFDMYIIFCFSLNTIWCILSSFSIEKCFTHLSIQGILASVSALLYHHYRLTIPIRIVTILTIFTTFSLSLANMIILFTVSTNSSILMLYLFNIGFTTLLQSFISRFNNFDDYMIYCLGIISTAINLFNNKIELIFLIPVIAVALHLNNRLLRCCTHVIRAIMLSSIMLALCTIPYITFIASSILLSKSYGYLEPLPHKSTSCIPSYGFKSLLCNIIFYTIIFIAAELGIINMRFRVAPSINKS